MGWIATIILGGIAGWLASMVMNRDASMGILWNIVVGVIGGLIGSAIGNVTGFLTDDGNWFMYLITAFVALLMPLVLLRRQRR